MVVLSREARTPALAGPSSRTSRFAAETLDYENEDVLHGRAPTVAERRMVTPGVGGDSTSQGRRVKRAEAA
jgi:hypothetical protein